MLFSALPVDVYADWCRPCRALAPLLDRLAASYEGRLRFVKVNADEEQDLISYYRVEGLLTLLLFRNCQLVDRVVGLSDCGRWWRNSTNWLLFWPQSTPDSEDRTVKLEPSLRAIAGVVVLGSLALGYLVSPYWHLLTAFAGLNLFQSGFSGWCPIIPVLRRLGAIPASYPCQASSTPVSRLEGQS